jgi:hypothetical protein
MPRLAPVTRATGVDMAGAEHSGPARVKVTRGSAPTQGAGMAPRRPEGLQLDEARLHFRPLHRAEELRDNYSVATVCPPSTTITLPVMYDPASDASRSSAPSSSAGCPIRRCGMRSMSCFPARVAQKALLSSVST